MAPALYLVNVLACDAERVPDAEPEPAADSGVIAEAPAADLPVHITQPREGNVVSGVQRVRGELEDGIGWVTAMDWSLDSAPLFHDDEEPSEWQWNTCSYPPGPHELSASAVDDRDGRTGRDTVTIEIDQGFLIAFSGFDNDFSPGDALQVWAADDREISEVVWWIDGVEVARSGAGEGVSTVECSAECDNLCQRFTADFDVLSLAEGDHPLEVRVMNAAGETLSKVTTLRRDGDADADGFDGPEWGGADCHDGDASVSPAAPERCDGRDNDCDGQVDEDFDVDGDGFIDAGRCEVGLDCDDLDPLVNPDAAEACDEVDNDCDGYIDVSEPPEHTGVVASDSLTATVAGQFWGNAYTPVHDVRLTFFDVYVRPTGSLLFSVYEADEGSGVYALVASSTIVPTGALEWVGSGTLDVELVGGRDYLLGVGADHGLSLRYERGPTLSEVTALVQGGLVKSTASIQPSTLADTPDANGLMYQTVHLWWIEEENLDVDGDGLNAWCGDCDDGDPYTAAGFPESCDGLDNDCDGAVPADEADADGDGDRVCDADCDDGDSLRYPSSVELCDGVDNDCDASTTEADGDGDGVLACWGGDGMDCADDDASMLTATRYLDADGDGHGDPFTASTGCPFAAGAVLDGDDCDDGDSATSPDASEVCDGIDNNCDGSIDEGFDADGDGVAACFDCHDTEPSVFPGAIEVCGDAVDDDCDGVAETCRFEGEYGAGEADAIVVGASAYECIGSSIGVGDFDGDGQADLMIAAYIADYDGLVNNGGVAVIRGPITADVEVNPAAATQLYGGDDDSFGSALAIADVDGDDLDDLVVGAYRDDDGGSDAGAAYVIPSATATTGPVDGIGFKLVGQDSGAYFGQSVASGDVNGDGNADVIVGAYLADNTETNQGAAWLFLGPIVGDLVTAFADAVLLGEESFDGAGRAVVSGADLTGDGIDDIVVGAHGNDWGALYVVSEAAGSLLLSGADTKIVGDAGADSLGYATPVLVDLDGDGWEDVVAGATQADGDAPGSGGVFAWYGPFGSTRSTASADVTLRGEYAQDTAGYPVVSLGDLDGDGPVDLLVGAAGSDANGGSAGAAYLVHGPLRGTFSLSHADAVFRGDAERDTFGAAAAGGADLSGDGVADVLFTASGSDRGQSGGGAVYLFNGPE
ncbi:hypothetical protein LBMAG42_21250 [Deltaproteobacteria bacterium]|nr:hypothetical protein LBMAG42_21250 [Deltaproteobacteria bacterium]